jgi:signal transduction histidine kinase
MDSSETLAPPVLPWLALTVTVSLALYAATPLMAPSAAGLAWPGLWAIYLLAELVAPSLNGFARFPLSAPALLVSAACADSGRGGWMVLALGGFLIRLLRAHLRKEPATACAMDALPEFLAGAVASLAASRLDSAWTGWLAALAYLLTWQRSAPLCSASLPEPLQARWEECRQRSLLPLGFLCILGAGVSAAFVAEPVAMLAVLLGALLLGIPIHAQSLALQSVDWEQERVQQAGALARQLASLDQRAEQIELQQKDVHLQLRCLSVVGELFQQSSRGGAPATLSTALLSSVRNVIGGSWVGLYKVDQPQCTLKASLGPAPLQPPETQLARLSEDRARPTRSQAGSVSQLAAQFSDRGLIVLRDQTPFDPAQADLLQRLTVHLPLCLDVIRYQESQSRALGGEQSMRTELNRLATRLTATLDLLARLVGCRSLDELVVTAQNSLPELILQYQAEVQWRGKTYKPAGGLNLARPAQEACWPLHSGLEEQGRLRLYSMASQPLSDLDRELLRLFSSQLSCLLETAELHDDLRRALEQLTLSQAQLVQSSKLAAIGQLAAGVAHELNTPLGAITVGSELVRKLIPDDPNKALERMKSVLTAASQMQEVISKLLLYGSYREAGRRPVDLYLVAHDTLLLVDSQGIKMELKGEAPPLVWGDPGELQQVVRNLVLNARDSGTARLELWLESGNGTVKLHVRDFGSGLDEATGQRIYEPFFSTKKVGQGTGLGLSTSLQLVEQHGGTLTHVSQVGQGTTFTVSLPVHREPSGD